MMGDDSRPRRILADLSSALRRDPKIDEFDFIYCPEPVVNRSPVVLENHKLGLQTWSINLLFKFVYSNLMKKSTTVKDLKSVHEFSCAVLLLNPDCYTVWNLRKELVMKRYIKAEDDLRLATIIQTKHPKSPETFIQRRWLLLQLFPSSSSSSRHTQQSHCHNSTAQHANGNFFHNQQHSNSNRGHAPGSSVNHSELTERQRQAIEREMDACRAAADRYPSNYNAWSHRIWVLKEIARLNTGVLLKELECTNSWVKQHISDHSGFNYRYFLLKNLSCNHPYEDLLRILHAELLFTSNLIQNFPGHEAIWYHRRAILTLGRECLKGGQCQVSQNIDFPVKVESPNGEMCQDISDTEPLVQEETEWLLLKDFSSASAFTCPKTLSTSATPKADTVAHAEYAAYERAISCADQDTQAALALLLCKENLFMESLLKKSFRADKPQLQRCINSHKRWLGHVQF
ncbi:protein prenyltransferase alpha subunit repeat-containing protein 1-like [Lytechinus pictus]|uniref:protein prenyltransferase alpha subunit repeat-containing protein 1-like n=1 Tax=Lytechinus pictus TaxID=7653 RepID=UPI0030BA0ACB